MCGRTILVQRIYKKSFQPGIVLKQGLVVRIEKTFSHIEENTDRLRGCRSSVRGIGRNQVKVPWQNMNTDILNLQMGISFHKIEHTVIIALVRGRLGKIKKFADGDIKSRQKCQGI